MRPKILGCEETCLMLLQRQPLLFIKYSGQSPQGTLCVPVRLTKDYYVVGVTNKLQPAVCHTVINRNKGGLGQ